MTTENKYRKENRGRREIEQREEIAREAEEQLFNELYARWRERLGPIGSELMSDIRTFIDLVKGEIEDTRERVIHEIIASWAMEYSTEMIPTEKIPIIPIEKIGIDKATMRRLANTYLLEKDLIEVLAQRAG